MPSRETVLRLATALGLELRERNPLLLAAGYAPVYHETSLDAPHMSAVRAMVRQLLAAHEPFPAVVLDRYWNRVDANQPALLFRADVAPELLKEPVNLLRVSLHPEGCAPRILNLGEWRAHLFSRLRQQIMMTADPELAKLYEELAGYLCDQAEPEIELPGPGQIAVPLRMVHEGQELTFFSTMATFGTPLDITVAEPAIESFYRSSCCWPLLAELHNSGCSGLPRERSSGSEGVLVRLGDPCLAAHCGPARSPRRGVRPPAVLGCKGPDG